MNAKAKLNAVADSIKSVKDAAYQFARTGETTANIARFIVSTAPDFPSEVSAELKADLNAGFMVRANELWGQDVYKIGDQGVLIKVANTMDADYATKTADLKGLRQYNVSVAFGLSQQEFGQLKSKDPQEHAIIKQWRDRFSKYAHNNLAALKLAARQLLNDGKSRERSGTKYFADALTDTFDSYDKRAKTAQARGDETADPVRYRMAVDAFWKAYKV